MTTSHPTVTSTRIDPETDVDTLSLTVSDLARSMEYYQSVIGLQLLDQSDGLSVLGAGSRPILMLTEQKGASEWPRGGRSYTGLYHFALLLPSRAALGEWLKHWFHLGYPMPGQADHLVSEAIYLEDPDGHGIEIYRDRPRADWVWEAGSVRMGNAPLDVPAILAASDVAPDAWPGLPEGTKLGHMHLQVGDIPEAEHFYHQLLGFDVVASMPTALFLSAGGYHHHLGLNVWHSRGGTPPPDSSVRLDQFSLTFPTESARREVVERLRSNGVSVEESADDFSVKDPWSNRIVLRVGEPVLP